MLNRCRGITSGGVLAIAASCGDRLQKLSLRSCSAVSDKALAALAEHCTALTDLDLGWCGIADPGLLMLATAPRFTLSTLCLKAICAYFRIYYQFILLD